MRLAGMDPQLRRSRTLDAVVRLLLSEARQSPLMLIVEDLHWLDDESQALLDLLVEQMADARILLLVNSGRNIGLRWGDKSYAQSLRLDALGQDNADEMLSAMLGESDEPVCRSSSSSSRRPEARRSSWRRRFRRCSTKAR